MFNDFKKLVYNITNRKLSKLKDIFDRLNLSDLQDRCKNLENLSLNIDTQLSSLNDTITRERKINPNWPNIPPIPPITPPPIINPITVEPLPPEDYDPTDPNGLNHTFIIFHAHNSEGIELGSLGYPAVLNGRTFPGNVDYFNITSPGILSDHNARRNVYPGTYSVSALFNGLNIPLGIITFSPYTVTTITSSFARVEIPFIISHSYSNTLQPPPNNPITGLSSISNDDGVVSASVLSNSYPDNIVIVSTHVFNFNISGTSSILSIISTIISPLPAALNSSSTDAQIQQSGSSISVPITIAKSFQIFRWFAQTFSNTNYPSMIPAIIGGIGYTYLIDAQNPPTSVIIDPGYAHTTVGMRGYPYFDQVVTDSMSVVGNLEVKISSVPYDINHIGF